MALPLAASSSALGGSTTLMPIRPRTVPTLPSFATRGPGDSSRLSTAVGSRQNSGIAFLKFVCVGCVALAAPTAQSVEFPFFW
jgi:hypothetical protein